MHTYKIDLETLLSLLGDAHQTGVLSTELPSGFLGQKARCWVRINLVNGEIVYCHLEDDQERIQVMDNEKSLNVLHGLGILSWRLDTDSLDERTQSFDKSNRRILEIPLSERGTNPSLPRIRPTGSLRISNTAPLGGRNTPSPAPPIQSTTGSLRMNSAPPVQATTGSLGVNPAAAKLFAAVPHMTTNFGPGVLPSLSRRQRRVLVLVDGIRNVEKIAALLFSTPQDVWIVLDLLQELAAMGMVTIENK